MLIQPPLFLPPAVVRAHRGRPSHRRHPQGLTCATARTFAALAHLCRPHGVFNQKLSQFAET